MLFVYLFVGIYLICIPLSFGLLLNSYFILFFFLLRLCVGDCYSLMVEVSWVFILNLIFPACVCIPIPCREHRKHDD
jgi:hypothetical protein